MSYSIISILALILNLIVNREPLKNIWVRSGEGKDGRRYVNRYTLKAEDFEKPLRVREV